MLERLIAYHCGPALAGIKPGNIVTCYKKQISNINKKIEQLNNSLNSSDIYLKIVCECEKKALIFVYRKKQLESYISQKEINKLLANYGYKNCHCLDEYIEHLSQRLKNFEFPHEIGAFLGYPVHDIYGFIHHRSTDCILTGEWRVYKDAENAKILFGRYRKCRNAILQKINNGQTLVQLFCAA